MDILNHILLGLLLVVAGVVSLKYNFQLVGFTGHIDFFENHLGAGSTYFGLKLLSIAMVIGGLLYMTGLSQPVLTFLLSPLAVFFHSPK